VFAREVCRAARYWTLELGKNFTPGGTRPDSIDSGRVVFSGTLAKHLEELIAIDEFGIVFHPGIPEGHRIMSSAGGVNAGQRESTCWGHGEGLGKWELGVTCHIPRRRGATIVRKGLRK